MGVGMWDPVDDTDYSLHRPLVIADAIPPYQAGPQAKPTSEEKGTFPAAYWNADFLALVTVAEFTRKGADWRRFALPPPPDEEETVREIAYLRRLAETARTERQIEETIAQNAGFLGYYLDLLVVTPASARQTYLVMKIASRVAELTMAYYKAKFNRARPSQLFPELMPPVLVAGHPSYPSGHALTAHLITLCLGDIAPEASAAMTALADRIAINREIAGLHFPSDTVAGRLAAQEAHKILSTCRGFTRARNAAQAEWAGRRRHAEYAAAQVRD